MLFVYQQSFYYRLHFFALIVFAVSIVYVIYSEFRLKRLQDEEPSSKCSEKMAYFDYVTNKQKTTTEAVAKLQ